LITAGIAAAAHDSAIEPNEGQGAHLAETQCFLHIVVLCERARFKREVVPPHVDPMLLEPRKIRSEVNQRWIDSWPANSARATQWSVKYFKSFHGSVLWV